MKGPHHDQDYADFVLHPRYGREPRFSGLNPNPDEPGINLPWNTRILSKRQRRTMAELLGKPNSRVPGLTPEVLPTMPISE
jgi:hypothetical protein